MYLSLAKKNELIRKVYLGEQFIYFGPLLEKSPPITRKPERVPPESLYEALRERTSLLDKIQGVRKVCPYRSSLECFVGGKTIFPLK